MAGEMLALLQVNKRIESMDGDTTLFDESQRVFKSNVHAYTRDGEMWLHTRRAFEKGEELFRFDGTISHCCSRGSSVREIIAARCGADNALSSESKTGGLPSSRKAVTEVGSDFPARNWQIILVKFYMPFKTSKTNSRDDVASETSTSNDEYEEEDAAVIIQRPAVECGQLFVVGNTEDFPGFHLFKSKAEFSAMKRSQSGVASLQDQPVRLEVDPSRTNMFRAVANTRLLKEDPIWVQRDVDDSREEDSSSSSAPDALQNSQKEKRDSSLNVEEVNLGDSDEDRDERVFKKLPVSKASTVMKKGKAFARRKASSSAHALTPTKGTEITELKPVRDVLVSGKKSSRVDISAPTRKQGLGARKRKESSKEGLKSKAETISRVKAARRSDLVESSEFGNPGYKSSACESTAKRPRLSAPDASAVRSRKGASASSQASAIPANVETKKLKKPRSSPRRKPSTMAEPTEAAESEAIESSEDYSESRTDGSDSSDAGSSSGSSSETGNDSDIITDDF